MSRITPIPGAVVVPFDHAAADAAIREIRILVGRLRALRLHEVQHAEHARIEWRGPSRLHFESRRGTATRELDAAIAALEATIDEIENRRVQAGLLQADANAEEMRARARDLERLEELAEKAA